MKSYAVTTLATILLAAAASMPALADTETRPLSAFDRVHAARGLDVTIVCGGTPQAKIEGIASDIADIELRLEGRTLTLGRASMHNSSHNHPVHIELTAATPLDSLDASSGASLKAPSCAVSKDHLDLQASSGGMLKLAANAGHLNAEVSSGGTIEPLSGKRIDASEAKLSASSGGTLKVCKVGNMRGQASSGGSIGTEPGGVANEIHSSSGGSIETESCS